jgi:hypothetical protein
VIEEPLHYVRIQHLRLLEPAAFFPVDQLEHLAELHVTSHEPLAGSKARSHGLDGGRVFPQPSLSQRELKGTRREVRLDLQDLV